LGKYNNWIEKGHVYCVESFYPGAGSFEERLFDSNNKEEFEAVPDFNWDITDNGVEYRRRYVRQYRQTLCCKRMVFTCQIVAKRKVAEDALFENLLKKETGDNKTGENENE
jgi:hypothetical protein